MSAARDLAKLGNTNTLKVDTISSKVGINSTVPTGDLQVGVAITVGSASGIISATAFYGDGSNLEGVSSAGLGTALSETDGDAAQLIYYTNNTLGIGSTVHIKVPTGSDVAYTQYADIDVAENVDFIVDAGDDFIPDVLGLSTAGVDVSSGQGGRVRAGYLINKAGTGAPQLTYGVEVPVGYGITGAGGINISGVATASSFSGNLTGNATGLSGTPDVTVNNVTAGFGTFSGNISAVDATLSGTLTYEDVTNVDSTGIVTAGKGFRATTGGIVVTAGVSTLGVTSVTDFTASGTLVEAFSSTTTAYSSSGDLNISNGNLQFCSANLGGTTNTLNIMSTTGINTDLAIGEALNVTAITAVNATTAYVDQITIDGKAVTENWVGGSAPTDGGGSGYDTYSFNILKTGSETFICIANQVKTS